MNNNNNNIHKQSDLSNPSQKPSGRRKVFAKPCSYPSCSNLANGRFCDDHMGAGDRRRGSASQRGYDNKWRKYRKSFLEQHPLCVMCESEGDIKVATVVDHIIPHKGDSEIFWDSNNHQPLCEFHHNQKTAGEDMGSWDSRGK